VNLARIILIVAALAIAIVTAFLVRGYLSQRESELTQQVQPEDENRIKAIEILVAARDLPTGTILNPEHLRWQNWPEDGLNEQYVSRETRPDAITELTGNAVVRPMLAGEPVSENKLVQPDTASFLGAVLKPGMRAYTMQVEPFEQVGGFVLPGAYVDILLVISYQPEGPAANEGDRRFVSETVLENVRVIAVDQTVNDVDTQARVSDTVTLEVTPAQVQNLAVARSMGRLTLSLRSLLEDPNAPPRFPYTADTAVSTFLNGGLDTRPRVMVAARDLPAGTLLNDVDLTLKPLNPGEQVVGLVVQSRQALAKYRGSFLKKAIRAGDAFYEDDLIQVGERGFMLAAMKPGMRAMSIAVFQSIAVAGFPSPGDYVDVIMTSSVNDTSDEPVLTPRQFAETVLRNVRLLAIEQRNFGNDEAPLIGNTVTLEVTPRQSEILALASRYGQLVLTLRSMPLADAQDPDKNKFVSDLELSAALRNYMVEGTYDERPLVEQRGLDTPSRLIRVYRGGVPSQVNTD
jgi:pilus assembly protein CpaB